MRKLWLSACVISVFGALFLGSPNAAFSQHDEGYTLDEAVAVVKKAVGGQVLKAESIESEGRLTHRIRVLTEGGRVRTFVVDAQDGLVP